MRLSLNLVKVPSLAAVARSALKKVKAIFAPRIPVVVGNIKVILRKYLDNSDTLQSLTSDDPNGLRVHFGLTHDMAEAAVEGIKQIWVDSVKGTKFIIFGSVGGFNVSAMKRDPGLFLEAPFSSYISPRSGEAINWLQWLLLDASSIKITGWRIFYKNSGRSGQAIMVKTKTRFWAIPAKYAQDEENNFINQIINDPSFQRDVQSAILSGLKGTPL